MKAIEKLIAREDFKQNDSWKVVTYQAGEEIITKGESSRSIYYIIQGKVNVLGVVEITEGSKAHPSVSEISKGEVFGELVLFDNEPRSASVVCMIDCELIVIDGDKLLLYLENNTDFGFPFLMEIVSSLVTRLRATNDKIFSLFSWGLNN